MEDVMKDLCTCLQFIDAPCVIPQFSYGVQLTVIKQLDIPYGHIKRLEGYLDLCRSTTTRVFHVT